MKNKISSLVKKNRVSDSKSYEELSPLLKEAVKDLIKNIDNNQKDIIKRFENSVEKVCKSHSINQHDLYCYFEKEINEQLGVK
jgi:hypothetical protein